jgi:hypothetical protein
MLFVGHIVTRTPITLHEQYKYLYFPCIHIYSSIYIAPLPRRDSGALDVASLTPFVVEKEWPSSPCAGVCARQL